MFIVIFHMEINKHVNRPPLLFYRIILNKKKVFKKMLNTKPGNYLRVIKFR